MDERAVHHVLALMTEKSSGSRCLCVHACARSVFACRICLWLHKHAVSVMRCSLHPSVLLAFASSEGDNRREMEEREKRYTQREREHHKDRDKQKRFYNNISFICLSTEQKYALTCRMLMLFTGDYLTWRKVSTYLWNKVWTCSSSSCRCGFNIVCVWERNLIVLFLLIFACFSPSALWPGCDTPHPLLRR